jgi:hypothetical protein
MDYNEFLTFCREVKMESLWDSYFEELIVCLTIYVLRKGWKLLSSFRVSGTSSEKCVKISKYRIMFLK